MQILAVLSKHADLQLHSQDVHVSTVGGIKVSEPAADLAVAMAVASSFRDQPLPHNCAFVGEIGEDTCLAKSGAVWALMHSVTLGQVSVKSFGASKSSHARMHSWTGKTAAADVCAMPKQWLEAVMCCAANFSLE